MKRISLGFIIAVVLGYGAFSFASESDPPPVMNNLPLVFNADFSQGADHWRPTDAKAWKIIQDDGVPVYALFQQSEYKPEVRSPVNYSLIKDLSVGDFILEAKLRSTKDFYPHRDMCLFFGWQDASHFYYVHLAPAKNTDPHANSIFIVNGEPRLSIAGKRNDGTIWKDGVYHTVRVIRDVKTGSIQVFFDNLLTPIMTAEDKTFLDGGIGVGSFDDIGNVKTFTIWGDKKN